MRRYSSRQGLTFGEGDKGVRRLQLVIIIVLAMALTAVLVLLIPNLSVRPELVSSCKTEMTAECKNAISDAGKLSSTGSAYSSNKPLASILSHVRVMQTLNRVYKDAGGQKPVDDVPFNTLLAAVDEYLAALTTGGSAPTNEFNIQIQEGLNNLMQLIDQM